MLLGRPLDRPRLPAPHALTLELRGDRSQRLWIDASRRAAGLYLVERAATAGVEERDPLALPPRDRQALLHLRKHVDGRRLAELVRPAGHRTLILDLGDVRLVLRLSGSPALSLVKGEAVLATMGEGAPAWPLPGTPPASPESLLVPRLALPRPYDACRDRDLAPADAVRFVAAEASGHVVAAGRWSELAPLFLVARRRGARFEAAQRRALREAARELRRLRRLEANLAADLEGLGDAATLRHQAEAILAAPSVVPRGASEAELPDPRSEGSLLRVPLDPRLEATENATRLFARARRLERARQQVARRLAETRREIEIAAEGQSRAQAAEDVGELAAPASGAERADSDKAKPRHYLTTRGLSILVGRGARENHRLTFSVARPEDLWLHVRDAPGAHVILRDPEGRAGADDLREAAETAAFFSDVREAGRVDVHVARRKHVRPARGGPGRVQVSHSDTLRVAPRDPEGQLRRR